MAKHFKDKTELWVFPARILCIDHGTKTLGLAISNSDQSVVTPLKTIHRTKWADNKVELTKIFTENDVSIVVVGYPLNMDGTKGARCQSVRDFVAVMEKEWPNLTFLFWDERLSTHTVDNILDNNRTMTREKRKEFKDALAAQIILEEVLSFALGKGLIKVR